MSIIVLERIDLGNGFEFRRIGAPDGPPLPYPFEIAPPDVEPNTPSIHGPTWIGTAEQLTEAMFERGIEPVR